MQRVEVSCAVRPIYGSLGAKGLTLNKLNRKCITMVFTVLTRQLFNIPVLVCQSMMQGNIMIQSSVLQKVAVYCFFPLDSKQEFGRFILSIEYCTGSTSDKFNSMHLFCYSFGGRV
jgi:hypothetical protein